MQQFTEEYRARYALLSTTNVSDALDALGLKGSTYGIRPMWHTMGKVLGPAVTLKMTAAGQTKGKYHLGVRAIDAAKSDPRIEGIYIRPNGQGAVSMAVLEELRASGIAVDQETLELIRVFM